MIIREIKQIENGIVVSHHFFVSQSAVSCFECMLIRISYLLDNCRTVNFSADPGSNAKWILNIKWEMRGIDVHLDTNIGKRLSALGQTLTSLTGEEDEEFLLDNTDGECLDVSLEDVSEYQV